MKLPIALVSSEWWTVNSVLDRSEGPCHPPAYIGREDFFRYRTVRAALLAALERRE
jgi:hypothetical protein